MVICLHRDALTQNAGLATAGGNKKIPSWANQKAAFEEVRPALQSLSDWPGPGVTAGSTDSHQHCQNTFSAQSKQ